MPITRLNGLYLSIDITCQSSQIKKNTLLRSAIQTYKVFKTL
jgi:hypothetical protein